VIWGSELTSVSLLAPRFISDLHLSRDQPRTLERFLRLTGQLDGGELLILGDLFEIWAGDEETAEGIGATVAAALRTARDRGTAIYLLVGNRDRLLGKRFAAAAGAVMLADPCRTVLDGVPTLLSHGDAYCTRDKAYMAWRRKSTNPILRLLFLSCPLAQRRAILGQVRQRSESGKKMMAADIMDVTPEAIDNALRQGHARRMIHGHTHRPDFHRFTLDGRSAERWVLPDWDFDGLVPRGGYLRLFDGRPEVVPV
jgi:UDP-2,3-diacylglucosamine hydrolase